jgi:hemin uptake protein HemP
MRRVSSDPPRPDLAADAAAPVPPSAPPGAPRQWTSEALLGEGREALIEHVGSVYRLRLTSTGKLILTK